MLADFVELVLVFNRRSVKECVEDWRPWEVALPICALIFVIQVVDAHIDAKDEVNVRVLNFLTQYVFSDTLCLLDAHGLGQ